VRPSSSLLLDPPRSLDPLALCSLLSALCSLLPALCSLLSALCSLLAAPCSLLATVCSLPSAPCLLLLADYASRQSGRRVAAHVRRPSGFDNDWPQQVTTNPPDLQTAGGSLSFALQALTCGEFCASFTNCGSCTSAFAGTPLTHNRCESPHPHPHLTVFIPHSYALFVSLCVTLCDQVWVATSPTARGARAPRRVSPSSRPRSTLALPPTSSAMSTLPPTRSNAAR
jgi:hypothetical protein